jgi:hypothetical protein
MPPSFHTSKAVSYVTLAVGIALAVLPQVATAVPAWAQWIGSALVALTLVKQTLAGSVSDNVRIQSAAEVQAAVVKVTNAVNDRIRASGRPPPFPYAPSIRTASTPPEGTPKL